MVWAAIHEKHAINAATFAWVCRIAVVLNSDLSSFEEIGLNMV